MDAVESTSDSIRERLAAALPQALKEHDTVAVTAIRSALAAIESATTEPSESDLLAIVLAQAAEREGDAAKYRTIGQPETADALTAEAAYLREFTV